MIQKAFIFFALSICLISTSGQTVSEINKQYGSRIRTYSVSAKIWMTPQYDSKGNVCEMTLYPKRFDGSTVYMRAVALDSLGLELFLNKIITSEERKKKPYLGGLAAGGVITSWYLYKDVTFTFYTSMEVTGGTFKPLSSNEDEIGKRENKAEGFVKAEIVTVRWNRRNCKSAK